VSDETGTYGTTTVMMVVVVVREARLPSLVYCDTCFCSYNVPLVRVLCLFCGDVLCSGVSATVVGVTSLRASLLRYHR